MTDSITLSWSSDGPIRVVIVVNAETCEDCGERVRYWNDSPTQGSAACGCTIEGPETCNPIPYRPLYLDLVKAALAEMTKPSIDELRALAKAMNERADREEAVSKLHETKQT